MSIASDAGLFDDLDVLLVDDDRDDCALIGSVLSRIELGPSRRGRCRLHDVPTLGAGLQALRESEYDVILLDLKLPDAEGLEALNRLMAAQTLAPILILTGLRDESIAVAAVKAGAQDFLDKAHLSTELLERAMRYAIERHHLRRELAIKARELEASEDRLRRLIAGAADGIVITDQQGTILFANPAAEALFNRPRARLLGTVLGLPVDGISAELELVRPDGRGLTAEMRVSLVDWHGTPSILAAFRDITAHKETLRQLDETRVRQLTVRDQFLSHVSHELRTPLTVAQQWTELLKDSLLGPVSPEQFKALETVLRNCRHLEKLIEDLLEAQRSDSGKLRIDPLRAHMPALAEEAVAAVRAAQRSLTIEFRLELEPNLPDLLADPSRIRQVLINLLSNAAKFTPGGGTVTLAAGRDPDAADELRVSVRDTGCGIPPEEQELVFEHLYQREMGPQVGRRGLGLGLYICRQIVTGHGGRIWVDSEVGKGSTFHFTVPTFSCRTLLARLPVSSGSDAPLHLIGIVVRPADGVVLQAFEAKFLDATRQVVSACIMPDRDLLLPRLVCDQWGELVFVIAAADAAGIAVLVERLRGQLAGAGDTGRNRLEFTFDTMPLPVGSYTGRPTSPWLDEVAPHLEAALGRMTAANRFGASAL